MHATYVVFAVVLGPIIGLVCVAYVRFIGWVSHHQVRGRLVLVGPLIAFVVVGLGSWGLPELLGNGADLAHSVLVGGGTASLAVLAALLVLKPLLTGLCLGSGATGGLFTPTLCTGALLGGVTGQLWSEAWPGAAVGGYAVIAAAAMLGAAMQAPLAALVLVTELTATTTSLVLPMAGATALATIVARYLDGYSIYTSRLSARPINSAPV
jgi:H+/Cl- antiporter ClcA